MTDELIHQIQQAAPQAEQAMLERIDERVKNFQDLPERPAQKLFRWQYAGAPLVAAAVAFAVILPSTSQEPLTTAQTSTSSELASPQTRTSNEGPASSAGQGAAKDVSSEDAAESSMIVPSPDIAPVPPTNGDVGEGPRQVQKAATLNVGVENVDDASGRVIAITDKYRGLVMNTNIATGTNQVPSATLSLRIPTASVGKALSDFGALGVVRERTQSSTDVTASFNAAEDELEQARAERKSLLAQLAKAKNASERKSINEQLQYNKQRLQNATNSLNTLSSSTKYAQVEVYLSAKDSPVPYPVDDSSWGFDDAADDAKEIIAVVAGVILVFFAALIPVALLGALFYFIARVWTAYMRRRALSKS